MKGREDQVVPEVFVFVVCLFIMGQIRKMLIHLDEDPLHKVKDESEKQAKTTA